MDHFNEEALYQQRASRQAEEEQLRDDSGTVICLDCEEPIAPLRLKAQPTAARCVDCETLQAKRERISAH